MWNDFKLRVQSLFSALAGREEGQALVEYALILTLVSVVALAVLTSLGNDIVSELTKVVGSL